MFVFVPEALLHFVEAGIFTKQVNAAGAEVMHAIQSDLIENPICGPVVRGTGGARKARVADSRSASGKSGGYRYMYLYFPHKGRIHLLFLFGKRDQANLSDEQKKWIAKMVAAIEKEAQ